MEDDAVRWCLRCEEAWSAEHVHADVGVCLRCLLNMPKPEMEFLQRRVNGQYD